MGVVLGGAGMVSTMPLHAAGAAARPLAEGATETVILREAGPVALRSGLGAALMVADAPLMLATSILIAVQLVICDVTGASVFEATAGVR